MPGHSNIPRERGTLGENNVVITKKGEALPMFGPSDMTQFELSIGDPVCFRIHDGGRRGPMATDIRAVHTEAVQYVLPPRERAA